MPSPGTHGPFSRIAVACGDGTPGSDAAVLAAALARPGRAEVILIGVYSDPLFPVPDEFGRHALRTQTEHHLHEVRDRYVPEARIAAENDISLARALTRVVEREHCDLLVVGSSSGAHEGRVLLDRRLRQLSEHLGCPIAVAPQGLGAGAPLELRTIAVGYDASPGSGVAIEVAGKLAEHAGAQLQIHAFLDDTMPPLAFGPLPSMPLPQWQTAVDAGLGELRTQVARLAQEGPPGTRGFAATGQPAHELVHVSEDADLLVLGSRHWGAIARFVLGSTADVALRDAACAVLVVRRPD